MYLRQLRWLLDISSSLLAQLFKHFSSFDIAISTFNRAQSDPLPEEEYEEVVCDCELCKAQTPCEAGRRHKRPESMYNYTF